MFIFGITLFLGLFAIGIILILFVVRVLLKKGPSYKKLLLSLLTSIAVFIVSGIFLPEPSPEEKAQQKEQKEEIAVAKSDSRKEVEDDKRDDIKRGDEKTKDEQKKPKQTKNDSKKKVADKDKQNEANQNEEDVNLTKSTDSNTIAGLLKEKFNNVDKVLIEENIAVVVLSDDIIWSETALFKDFAIDSTSIMRELKHNNNLKGVGFVQLLPLTDQKGNESLERVMIAYFDKENYDEINFKNFVNQIYADSSNFYKVSNGYWMHPSIYQNIDEKTLNGLPFVPSESSKGFETVSNITD